MNKKGFSLVELLVSIAIIGILAAMLAPAMTSSSSDAKKEMDETGLASLTTTIQMAMQHNTIYKDAKKIADDTVDGKIVILYTVEPDNTVAINYCKVVDKVQGQCTDASGGNIGEGLENLKVRLSDYINGKMEPIELKSKHYRERKYQFTITFPDVDFKVNVDMKVIPD